MCWHYNKKIKKINKKIKKKKKINVCGWYAEYTACASSKVFYTVPPPPPPPPPIPQPDVIRLWTYLTDTPYTHTRKG